MAHHQHRRTYTRTILFSETFDFPTPPTWGQDEAVFPLAFSGHQYHQRASQMPSTQWTSMPPTTMVMRPMSRMPAASHVPVTTLYDKPLPEYPQHNANDFIIDCSNSENTAAAPVAVAPSPGEVSRWSICSDDTVVESMSRPLSPSSSIQKLRSMASSTALRSVKSSMKLRSKLNTTLKQLKKRTLSMG